MCRVLLVDDESMARTGLRTTFDWIGNGYEVVGEASNGRKAMKWIENNEVDILITDIAMPVMDGLELTRLARQLCPWLKVLLLSCHNDFKYVREGIRLGASDYVLKPTLESEDLKKILDNMRIQVNQEKDRMKLYDIIGLQKDRDYAALWDNEALGVSLHQRIINEAIEYMNQHYTKMISLQDVANEVSVSKNYFSELFKRETGFNFIEYMIQIRLSRAKELLRTTKLRVYEVAEMSGFNDTKYFSRKFKKVVGVSPAEFQSLRRENIEENRKQVTISE